MSAHVPGTWWAIERLHTDGPYEGLWRLQWEPDPCWPRLFTRRSEVRQHLIERQAKEPDWADRAWLRKHWRLRPVKVRVERI